MTTSGHARLLSAIASLAIAWVSTALHAADAPERFPTGGWPHGTPVSVGLDGAALGALDSDIRGGKFGLVDSFEVFRCGREVFERTYDHNYGKLYSREAHTRGPLNARLSGPYNYFDPYWHPYYHGSRLHTMQSVSKTITSVIIGIAVARGDFKAGLDTPVLNYFDAGKVENLDERKRRMTLRDVLTMTTGLDWNEDVPYDDPRSDSSLMEATDDWVKYVIDKPMAHDPGTVFNYSSGATELLAYIFQKETGQDIDTYGQRHLFAPLGIRHHWKRTYLGLIDTEGGLYLDGADLAKIGYLYLHDGMWEGHRLVTADWIHQSLTPAIDTGWQGLKYGFKWWLQVSGDGKETIWHAIGLGGQRLIVFPRERLIATFTGWDILRDAAYDAVLANRVLEAVQHDSCPGPTH